MIIRTKLRRPRAPRDFFRRERLERELDRFSEGVLTLVSAGAGWGKTAVVSAWLAERDHASAWISLDPSDADLRTFLAYLVAAVEDVFPGSLSQSETILRGGALPAMVEVVGTLLNELDEIEEPLLVVLDDVHLVGASRDLTDALTLMLSHPPRDFHLVLITGRDPFLPLSRLRAAGTLVEIRASDLAFTPAEAAAFLEAGLGSKLEEPVLLDWLQETEGWAVGLRLALLASTVGDLPVTTGDRGVRRDSDAFLRREVLPILPESLVLRLVRSALIEPFNASLMAHVENSVDHPGHSRAEFGAWLESRDAEALFVTPLEDDGDGVAWFRYYRLFGDFLRREATLRLSKEELRAVHLAAAAWHEVGDHRTLAVQHRVSGNDLEGAERVVLAFLDDTLAQDRGDVVASWLSQIPAPFLRLRPPLIVAKAWVDFWGSDFAQLADTLALLDSNPEVAEVLDAEMSFFRGILMLSGGDPEGARRELNRAVTSISPTHVHRHGKAVLALGLAIQSTTGTEASVSYYESVLADAERDGAGPFLGTRTLGGLAIVHLLDATPQAIKGHLELMHEHAHHGELPLAAGSASYLAGSKHLHMGEFERAAAHFEQAISHRFELGRRWAADSFVGLALAYDLHERVERSDATLAAMSRFVANAGDAGTRELLVSAQSRIAARRGTLGIPSVSRVPPPADPFPFLWIDDPHTTALRCVIHAGDPHGLLQAREALAQLIEQSQRQQNRLRLTTLHALHALTFDDGSDEADEAMSLSLACGSPGRIVMPYIELHTAIRPLLTRARIADPAVADFVSVILGKPPVGRSAASTSAKGSDALTAREVEVLSWLAAGLYQHEIAASLFVSPETIKTHTKHIYGKLGVHGRRDAVTRAQALGLIDS